MLKCPYCYEVVVDKDADRCPHCHQFIIDDLIPADFPSVDKKRCLFCGKQILSEAKICKFCQKWLDEVDRVVDDLDLDNLYD